MFDIGWQELFIVAVLALIIVGPKDLPRALRTIVGVVRKARIMARDFQDGIDEVAREADLDDMKKKIEDYSDTDIKNEIQEALDPIEDLASDLNMTEIQDTISAHVDDDINDADKLHSATSLSKEKKENKASQVDPKDNS